MVGRGWSGAVQGEGLRAKDIAFENSAGPGSQAVALISAFSLDIKTRCTVSRGGNSTESQGRSFLQSSSGFVFQNSSFTVASDMQLRIQEFVVDLGRTWFEYSTVVIMECYIDDIISPARWDEWPPKPTDKLTYIEYKKRRPGANVNGRVN
ncbi:hypothetical protein BUALT_BualtUnG0053000 [Buddleja alternifolia]|uniref:Pectinesterase catalytic domain-containing protein n=1 Tax=Buddleja alternifolia TaxID=168488 RepID=A0AAV6W6P0_9LAMI|nr:hypothetical protein BUALT_BualtUnG0053000 [Buddleja alternifolia]